MITGRKIERSGNMSDEPDRRQLDRQHTASIQRKPAQFDEAPGEDEADAVRDAFLKGAGQSAASVASALSSADGATQARAINRLQAERGNAYVQRVMAEAHGIPGRLVGASQPAMVDEVLQRKGAGSSLPSGPREQMEASFGADLGAVRVHSDNESAALNRELAAQAFTVGNDVFFAENRYNPTSGEGQGLLAHELTHVGQQTGFAGQGVQRQAEPEEEEQVPVASSEAAPKRPEEETQAG
jgi:hypothetical protein